MEGNYPVLMGNQEIGRVKVTRQGLYYRFDCRCQLSGDVVCRLTVTCGAATHNLGILVPERGAFCLRTKIPVKQLGDGALQFGVRPNHKPVGSRFVPISPEEPFHYLSRLQDAFLEIRDGIPGLVISGEESG